VRVGLAAASHFCRPQREQPPFEECWRVPTVEAASSSAAPTRPSSRQHSFASAGVSCVQGQLHELLDITGRRCHGR